MSPPRNERGPAPAAAGTGHPNDPDDNRSEAHRTSGVSASSDTLAVGDSVRCERAEPARGTWSRYSGRTGIVVTVNVRDGEYGVSFTDDVGHVDAWFLLTELAVLSGAQAAERPSRRRKPCPCPDGADCRIARQADGGQSHRRKWKRLDALAGVTS